LFSVIGGSTAFIDLRIGSQRDWPQKAALVQRKPEGCVVETILILDDDSAILKCTGDFLRFEHYSVLEASTGLEALEVGKRRSISLLVTDIELPDGSGIDVAVKLVASYRDLPVLVISGHPMAWWARKDLSNFSRFPPDNVDFLEKPFPASELIMRVRNLIGRRSQVVVGRREGNQAASAARSSRHRSSCGSRPFVISTKVLQRFLKFV
jgi:DNA-binding response OmpR family regulator